MQDRYAGDVGDFGKLALLRALSSGRRTGVAWYRTEGHGETNNDGNHLSYLTQPARFERLAPPVFSALKALHGSGRPRSIAALEQLGLLPPATVFHSAVCPSRQPQRKSWTDDMVRQMNAAELVFLDPDNGIAGETPSHKSVELDELRKLRASGRALLVYHHQTRRKGGAQAEFAHQAQRLRGVGFEDVRAVRLKPFSSRFYFLLDSDPELHERLREFADTWGPEAETFA